MYKGGSKLIPIILVIIVTVVAIIAFVSIGRALLGRDSPVQEVVESPAHRALLTTEADRSVRMTVRGPIVADEDFHSYQIEVSPIERRMTTYRGYSNEIIDTTRLSGSATSYAEFVHALERVNFTNKELLPEERSDTRGLCATGRLYTFELLQAQSVTDESWISSCSGLKGSFAGEAVRVKELFQKQIPDSSSMLRGLNL